MASQNRKEKGSYKLDHQLLVELADLVEELTTSGETTLDLENMKKLKKICKKSDGYVDYAHKQLMSQLEQEHAEIRLSSFQVMNELFQRSHLFREMLVADMQEFLLLTIETDVDFPLPPPKAAAALLKEQTLVAIADWNSKFGKAYKKLGVGYNFLKHCKKINFDNIIARLEATRERERNMAEREERIRQEKCSKAVQEMTEIIPEIDKCLRETESCYNILFPKNSLTMDTQTVLLNANNGGDEGCSRLSGQMSNTAQCSRLTAGVAKHSKMGDKGFRKKSHDLFEETSNSEVDSGRELGDLLSTPSCQQSALNPLSGGCNLNDNSDGSQCNDSSGGKEGMELKNVQRALTSGESEKDAEHVTDDRGSNTNDDDDEEEDQEDEDDKEDEEDSDSEDEEMQSHGIRSFIQNISIDIEIPTEGVMLVEDDNNTDLLSALDDAKKLLDSKYLKQVHSWIETFKKANKTETDFFKKCVDLHISLSEALEKYNDLKIKRTPKTRRVESKDPDSDDEFEDVPEKEGYEPVIEESRREEYGLPSLVEKASSSKVTAASSSVSSSGRGKASSISNSEPMERHHMDWHPLFSCEHDPKDPTSIAATLAVLEKGKKTTSIGSKRPNSSLQREDETANDNSELAPPQKLQKQECQDLLSRAPVIPFGVDLEHWENPGSVKVPVILRTQTENRIWTSNSRDEEVILESAKEDLTRRVFSFTGSFVPVKWKCRAPLPSGKLCDRMDRVKCPFHGKIIPRNEDGIPSTPVDVPQVKVENDIAPPDDGIGPSLPSIETPSLSWQDPELLRDIKAATGMDLTLKKGRGKKDSKKGKGKKGKKGSKKYPGLTDLTKRTNTSRTRLEKRVFNKSSMKRVNAKLTAIDDRRVRDKFSNQFHYALKS